MSISASDLLILMKVRLNSLVVFTTAGGYYMALSGPFDFGHMALTCFSTALVASGAAGLNQVAERDVDQLMARTASRPVAAGRMSPAIARTFSLSLIVIGLAGLLWIAPLLSASIAAITAFVYVVVYTPMKRVSSLATIVGAVPGALPPLIGWTAAGGTLTEPAPWSLFLLMFVWQLPHFLSISWMYRDDYAKAGLPMLAVVDRDGSMTGRQAALWAGTLMPIALLPAAAHLTEPSYGIGAAILGVGFVYTAIRFARSRSRSDARNLFLASITYLPLLWILMAITRH